MWEIAKKQACLERNHELTEEVVRERTEELQVAKAELQAMHDASPLGMFMADSQGNYVYCNHMYEFISGLTSDRAQSRGWLAIVHPSDRDRVEQEWNRAVRSAAPYESVYRFQRESGRELWVSVKAATLFNGDSQLGYVGTLEDITARKQAEINLQNHARELEATQRTLQQQARELEMRTEQLEEAHVVAEQANLAKSEFLANMSHEIRTPMTAILGFADILAEDAEKPAEIEAISTIKRNGTYLLKIINDILDLSKIEAGKFSVDKRRCSACQIVSDVASLMRVPASAKQLPLVVEYVGPIPEFIECDSTRLRQVLINLIGNAIKFTQTGRVRVVVSYLDSDRRPRLQFDIVDTGIGMTQEELQRLFQPFTQADASTSRRFGGTGLGLTISQRLAEMMEGSVTVESAPGHGSTFRLIIPTGNMEGVRMLADPSEAGVSKAEVARSTPTCDIKSRVLLAEDGLDNQRLISFVLKKAGIDVTLAEDGQLALDLALAAKAAGEPFDVILMDMQMPVLDGYAATMRLREAGYTGPIIALTAHAMTNDREKCIAAGCDEYAAKPIDRTRLLFLVEQFSQRGKVHA